MNVIAQEWSMRFASRWMRSCNCGETLSVSAQRKPAEARIATKARVFVLLLIGRELLPVQKSWQQFFAILLWRYAGLFLFVAPHMKGVGEHDISHQSIRMIIGEIERGINLKVGRDVPSESNRRGIFPPALEIDLHPPLLIKIISVTENRFVFVTGMDRTCEDFVMLGAVARFDIRLRVDVQMRRPIHEADRKKIRFLCQQSEFGRENPIVRIETAKHRYFRPFGQAHLRLQFVWVCNPLVLNLETQRQVALLL